MGYVAKWKLELFDNGLSRRALRQVLGNQLVAQGQPRTDTRQADIWDAFIAEVIEEEGITDSRQLAYLKA